LTPQRSHPPAHAERSRSIMPEPVAAPSSVPPPRRTRYACAMAGSLTTARQDCGTGQPVRVKVEAYPFTDDGLIAGRVDRISSDAIQDEKLGLALVARVRWPRLVDGGHFNYGCSSEVVGVYPDFFETTRAVEKQLDPTITKLRTAGGAIRHRGFIAIDFGFGQEALNALDNLIQPASRANAKRDDGPGTDTADLKRLHDQFTFGEIVLHIIGVDVSAVALPVDTSAVIYKGERFRGLSGAEWNGREALLGGPEQFYP
jgi:hypothetical protein